MEKNIDIRKSINDSNSGNYTIEAAIILPLVIVGGLTLANVIYGVFLKENIAYIGADEGKKISIESYDNKYNFSFPQILEERILKENKKLIQTNVSEFGYLYKRDGIEGIISYKVDYRATTNLPLDFQDEYSGEEKFIVRGYVGKISPWEPATFEKMEEEGREVWIFPESGKKYHKENCTYVTSNYKMGFLNEDFKNKYDHCDVCNNEKAEIGNIIYYFPNHGENYHFNHCKTIDKYALPIEEGQAIDRGYTPCLKCGG